MLSDVASESSVPSPLSLASALSARLRRPRPPRRRLRRLLSPSPSSAESWSSDVPDACSSPRASAADVSSSSSSSSGASPPSSTALGGPAGRLAARRRRGASSSTSGAWTGPRCRARSALLLRLRGCLRVRGGFGRLGSGSTTAAAAAARLLRACGRSSSLVRRSPRWRCRPTARWSPFLWPSSRPSWSGARCGRLRSAVGGSARHIRGAGVGRRRAAAFFAARLRAASWPVPRHRLLRRRPSHLWPARPLVHPARSSWTWSVGSLSSITGFSRLPRGAGHPCGSAWGGCRLRPDGHRRKIVVASQCSRCQSPGARRSAAPAASRSGANGSATVPDFSSSSPCAMRVTWGGDAGARPATA